MGIENENEKDNDIVDISEEIKEKTPEETEGKKAKKKKEKKPEKEVSINEFRKDKNKRKKKALIITGVILLIVGFITYKVIDTKKKLEEMLNNNNVQTAKIERRDISQAISTTGTIQSKDVRTLTSPLSGVKIDTVNYKVGDMVQAGAIVVTFSREDINKKIGQLEEDITEAKQAKALDAGDRTNTYVNSYDLQVYGVATKYEAFQKAEKDLQKAKEDLARACSDKGDFKSLHEEAKEKIDSVQKELIDAQKKKDDAIAAGDKDKQAEWTNEVSRLTNKITKYRDALDNYDTNIEKLESSERTAQTALDTAQRAYDNAWVDYNKAGYDASFSDAKSDYTKDKGDLQANDNIKSLERQKEQNEDSLDNYIVTAPITGLVTSVNAQEGNGYQATTGALMTIQAVDVFEVTTQVDEYDINNVKIGQKVAIMTDATGQDELEGVVTFVAPTATAASGNSTSNTFEVKIDIKNKDERLKLGMSAKLNILVDTHENVLSVPYDAIEQKDDGNMYIYVTDGSGAGPGKPDDNKGSGGITVIGTDGEQKNTDMPGSSADQSQQLFDSAKANAKEIQVTVGLEGEFYTEISSPEIKEGMTVLVDSKAGELQNDMSLMMGM